MLGIAGQLKVDNGAVVGETLQVTGKIVYDGGDALSSQDGGAVRTQTWSRYFRSSTTHTVATLSGTGSGLVAIVRIDYTILYSYAEGYHAVGFHVSSTRRSEHGSKWVTKSGVQMCNGDCGYAPEIKWTDGVLTLKTAGSVQCTAQITLTYHDTSNVA